MKKHVFTMFLLAGVAGPAAAQAQDETRVRQEAAEKQMAEESTMVRQVKLLGKLRERLAVETRTTTGAPYTAEAVTESTQVLADGNRINQKTTTRVYRDGEGRTRREQLNAGGAIESVAIVDPVGDTRFFSSTAAAPNGGPGAPAPGTVMYKRNVFKTAGPVDEAKMKAEAGALERVGTELDHVVLERTPEGQGVREDLGTSTIEGLTATGTRTTTTIPAGAIGNLQPIQVVSEEWFSPDLQVMLLTRYSDPRSGETVYRLQNIIRTEPDHSLFTMPEGEKGLPGRSEIKEPEQESR
jgi:hypothetical protein